MKAWWQQLNSREQQLVLAMSAVIGIFIFYSVVWQPLNDNLANASKKLKKQEALLTWVQDNTALYRQAKSAGGKTQLKGSISSVANKSAKRFQLTITRMQPQGNDLQVWIDSTPFTQLLLWLEHLANNEGLKVKSIDLSKGERTGEAAVRRLHLTKA